MMLGFLQVNQWFKPMKLNLVSNPLQWGIKWNPGGFVEDWANPYYVGWSNTLGSNCRSGDLNHADWFFVNVVSPSRDPQFMAAKLEAVAPLVSLKYSPTHLVFQAVIGGPNNQPCSTYGVEVSAWHPVAEQAISIALQRNPLWIRGPSVLADSCGQFGDYRGHLLEGTELLFGKKFLDFYQSRFGLN